MPTPQTFGEWLRRRRRSLGLTQAELGGQAGYSEHTIRAVEANHRRPGREMAEILAVILRIAPEERAAFVRFARDEAGAIDPPRLPDVSLPAPLPANRATLTNLPVPLTPLIDRVKELATLQDLLRAADVRLVTLTGTAGVGKTRLAIQAASHLLNEFDQGVFFVNLAPLPSSRLVVSTMAQTLDIQEQGGQSLLERLKVGLRDRRVLLVLDNFEHVIDAASVLADLLVAAPQVKMLITSRMPLRVRGEREVGVHPLPYPPHGPTMSSERLSQYEAVQLFIQRALEVKPDFQVTNANAPAVAEICSRLDGLPLAIELAAARVRLLSPEALLTRLAQRLKYLIGGARDLPQRQQTLRATLDWSYNLLDKDEQTLFRRLAVFVGGGTLEAIETVCGSARTSTLAPLSRDPLDLVSSLVEKNLVRVYEQGGEARFTMLQTVLEYATEQLAASGERETIFGRHSQFYLALVQQAEPELQGPHQGTLLSCLEAERDNLRSALAWSLGDRGHADTALKLAAALVLFWYARGPCSEGQAWLESALAQAPTASVEARAKAHSAAGTLAYHQGDYARATDFHQVALALYRECCNSRGEVFSLSNLGYQARAQGKLELATGLFEQALGLFRELGDKRGVAEQLLCLGEVARSQSRDEEAARLYVESLEHYQALNDTASCGGILHNLGHIALHQGDTQEARRYFVEGLNLACASGNRLILSGLLHGLGCVMVAEGRPARQSAQLFGAAAATLAAVGGSLEDVDRREIEHAMAIVRHQLPEATFNVAWAEGQEMTLAEAVTFALAER